MKSLVATFLHAVLPNSPRRRRDITISFGEVGRIFLQDRAHRIRRRLPVKRALARNHFVENRGEAEYVGARIHGQAAHLLRRHISRSTHHYAGFGSVSHGGQRSVIARLRLSQFGEAEVENFYAAILRDENIFWLQVAMNDAFLMSRGESMRDLQSVIQSLAGGDRSATQTVA